MTINELRHHINKNGAVDFGGMAFKLLEHDIVRIKTDTDIYEVKYTNFADTNYNLHLSDKVLNVELTDLKIKRDEEFPHTIVLSLDIRHKEKKEEIDTGIQTGAKFI